MRSVTANDSILVDTSIWIGYFQGGLADHVDGLMEEVLEAADIHVPKVVLAELIQGAHSEREISAIRRFLGAFRVIAEGPESWMKAGRLSYDLRRRGSTVHITDCYISILAQERGCTIFSLDRHFAQIAKVTGQELLPE